MKRLSMMVLVLLLTVILAACGNEGTPSNANENGGDSGTAEGSSGEAEIVFQSHITPTLTGELYDNAIARFEEQNPNVTVTRIEGPDTDSTKYVKTLLASGDMPDVVHNVATFDLVEADALMPIPVDEDIKKISDYDAQMIDGNLYNLFPYVQPHSLIFYNKSLFEQAGITEEPATWGEFMEVNQTLKDNDITPILTSGEWITGMTFSILTSPGIYGNNEDWYADKNAGDVSYTDPEYLDMAKEFQGISEKGYFNEGALSIGYSQLDPMFFNGEGAMYPMGIWFTAAIEQANPDFEIGVFPMPSKDGKKHLLGGVNWGGWSVSKESEHPDEALKLVKFLAMDPEFHKAYGQADGLISNLEDPIYYDMSPLQEEAATIVEEADTITGHIDLPVGGKPAPGILDQITKVAQNLIVGEDVEEQMESLDTYWEEHTN